MSILYLFTCLSFCRIFLFCSSSYLSHCGPSSTCDTLVFHVYLRGRQREPGEGGEAGVSCSKHHHSLLLKERCCSSPLTRFVPQFLSFLFSLSLSFPCLLSFTVSFLISHYLPRFVTHVSLVLVSLVLRLSLPPSSLVSHVSYCLSYPLLFTAEFVQCLFRYPSSRVFYCFTRLLLFTVSLTSYLRVSPRLLSFAVSLILLFVSLIISYIVCCYAVS